MTSWLLQETGRLLWESTFHLLVGLLDKLQCRGNCSQSIIGRVATSTSHHFCDVSCDLLKHKNDELCKSNFLMVNNQGKDLLFSVLVAIIAWKDKLYPSTPFRFISTNQNRVIEVREDKKSWEFFRYSFICFLSCVANHVVLKSNTELFFFKMR